MAEPLKYMYDKSFISELIGFSEHIIPGFDAVKFSTHFFNPYWDSLELKQRVKHVADAMADQLSGNYLRDIEVVTQLTKHIMVQLNGATTFTHIFIADYIERYGINHPEESLNAMEYATIISSCEFAIRPFIVKYPDMVMSQMLHWTNHPHASVRRLASEGCRPRLPWGMALVAFKKDPSPILPILEQLKNDPSEYVRKSVANNLNDIAKDNPEVVTDIIKAWKGSSKETDWILKHGSRTLLKKADKHTLSLFGVSAVSSATVTDLKVKHDIINIGGVLQFSFVLMHKEKLATVLRVEYLIYYRKSNGSLSKKIFKVTEQAFQSIKPQTISRKQSFKDMTTRKHYAGEHQLAIVVNGVELSKTSFMVNKD